MADGIKIALLLCIISICFVWCFYLISSIAVNVLLIAMDKENTGSVYWNRLNTIFVTEYLSDKSKIKREKVKKNIVRLLGNIFVLFISYLLLV